VTESPHSYAGLIRALGLTPAAVRAEVAAADIRERRTAGSPLVDRWLLCADAPGAEKHVVCDAGRHDPVAFAVPTLVEIDANAVCEGLAITAYAVGASRGHVYVSGDCAAMVASLAAALAHMAERGFLGADILGSDFSLEIEVHERPAASVCSEDMALIRALEGRRADPIPRATTAWGPGLLGQPTVISSAETLARVATVLGAGSSSPDAAASGPVTLRYTLAGAVIRTGVAEMPLGVTLRELIYEAGGGVDPGVEFKAVQTGGVTGGWLPATALGLPADDEHLRAAGSSLGSGSLIVVGGHSCAVDVVRRCYAVIADESCGLCVACREGTMQMAEILADMTTGRGADEDIDVLLDLASNLSLTGPCDWGKAAANPLLTALAHFRDEFDAHVHEKTCPAGVCSMDGGR
jgi:NADH:ubiquinone oxidoreductase subunit F (NADH-binding)